MKRIILLFLTLLIFSSCSLSRTNQNKSEDANTTVTNENKIETTIETNIFDPKIKSKEIYNVDTVVDAITNQNTNILDKILLPTSMDIVFPKIDTSKIIEINSPLLSELPEKNVFFEELKKHNIDNTNITLAEYYVIESYWAMEEEDISDARVIYPELESEDLSKWTIGDFKNYIENKNIILLKNKFTPEQLKQLAKRKINIEDTFYLFKEYHSANNILSKSDIELKSTIENYYRTAVELTMGSDAYNQICKHYDCITQ